jgi:hypothetical protein
MSRPIREKLVRPLRSVIRRKMGDRELDEATHIRLRRLLVRPDLLDRLCAQLESHAAAVGAAAELSLLDPVGDFSDDDEDRGWRFYLSWIVDNWSTILQLLAIIIPLLAADREES